MNSPENDPPSPESVQAEPPAKKSLRRIAIILLICLIGCSGLLVPAIRAAREAARCDSCHWHLKQIGLALLGIRCRKRKLAAGVPLRCKGEADSFWHALFMPFFGYYDWRKSYSLKEPWDGPNNDNFRSWRCDGFQCPSVDDPSRVTVDYVAVVGPNTMWPGRDRVSLPGNQDTILLIEMPDSDYRCLEPRSPTVEEFLAKIKSPTGKGIRCIHPKGLAYVTVGGEVRVPARHRPGNHSADAQTQSKLRSNPRSREDEDYRRVEEQ